MPVGLVLEGGGMRGWYTAGVLSVFTKNKITFPVVYGISAGSINALSYISGQSTEESIRVLIKYTGDKRVLSTENLDKTGSAFGFDFMFGEMFHTITPFDYKKFFKSPVRMEAGTTDMETGKAKFFGKEDMDDSFTVIRASCSLPMISNIVHFKGYNLMDGGYSQPIPIEHSIEEGNGRNIIVLTREASYRKSMKPEIDSPTLHKNYGEYPAFIKDVLHRPQVYNNELKLCADIEKAGKAIVIRPSRPIKIGRCENNPEILWKIYQLGIRDCTALLPKIHAFLKA
jgi:predicted patatin/cPLA2 family phospholipase